MQPPGGLPGENQSIAVGPHQIVGRLARRERAAAAGLRLPDFVALACANVGQPYRPRRAFALELCESSMSGDADKRDARAVRRPGDRTISIDARSEPGDGIVREIIDANEAVVPASAHECQARAVG